MTMLIQRVNILCSTVLHISIDRLNYIIANIEKFYIEYQKPKRTKMVQSVLISRNIKSDMENIGLEP